MDVRKGGAWVSPNRAEAFIGGSWRNINYAEAYISGAWRRIATFVAPLTVNATSPVTATNGATTTDVSTASPSGGLGPFTYSWALLSNSGITSPAITSPSTASTRFTGSPTDGHSGSAVFRVTVTDSLGSTAHADVTASWFLFSQSGTGAS